MSSVWFADPTFWFAVAAWLLVFPVGWACLYVFTVRREERRQRDARRQRIAGRLWDQQHGARR